MKYIMILLAPFVLLAQMENWIYTYNGNLNLIDGAEALTCGLDGNTYVVGRTANYGTSSDFIVVNLNDNGDTNWIYMYNPRNLEDIAFAVEYGLDHNIYAAGFSSAPVSCSDFMVLSLTTGGDTNWTYRHDGPCTIQDYDMACAITYGLDGNIYAGGTSYARYGAGDFFVVSLSAAGDTNWTYRHGDTTVSAGMVRAIEYGADGNIYAAGRNHYEGSHYDFFVVSLSTAGDTNWTYSYSGALDHDAAYSVTYGQDGNIYVAGYTSEVDSLWFFTVVSLTDEGDENWVFRYPSEIIYVFRPANVIVYGLDNNIYAAGKCLLPGESEDFFVVSLSTAGDTNWTYRRNGKANDRDYANEIVYGSDGNIYAAGIICDDIRGPDFAVVSLSADGTENWLYTYSALQIYRLDEAHSIDYGSDGHIYAAGSGSQAGSFWNYDFTVVSLEPATGVEEVKTDHAQLVRLEAMPNPFTHLTDIRYQITDDRKVHVIKVYDITGHLVTDLSEQISVIGHQSSVKWDGTDAAGMHVPAGVYFVTLEADDARVTEKVLLAR